MVPILGKPVMEYLIEHLARHGVTEIMVNVAYHHHKIEEYFGDGSRWGVEIGYAYEGVREYGDILPRPKGSAGGMRSIQDQSGFFDETTIVLCGDALIDLDITAALAEHHSKAAIASVVAMDVPLADVQSYGIVVATKEGRIESFQEKPQPQDAKSTHHKAFFVQNRPFHWIDIGRVSDYWSVLQRVLNGEIAAMPMPGKQVRPGVWVGINTAVDWDQVTIQGPVYIGSSVRIEPGAKIIGPSWIGHGSLIRSGATITRGVLFEYTRIAAGMHFEEMIVSRHYCVDRHGETLYVGDETSPLRWGDARAST